MDQDTIFAFLLGGCAAAIFMLRYYSKDVLSAQNMTAKRPGAVPRDGAEKSMLHTANKSSGQKEVIDLLHVTDKILREWKEPEWRAARAFSAQLDAIAHLAVDPSSLIPRSAATQPSSRRPSSGDAPQQPYDQPQPSDHLQDGPNFHDPTPQSPSLRPVDHGTGAGAQPQYGQRRGRASGKQRNRRRSGSDRRRNDYLNNGGFVGGSYPGQFNPTAQEPFTVREDHPFDQVGR